MISSVEAAARKGNSESYAPSFQEPLKEGTEFVVLEERGDWVHMSLSGDLSGWIRQAEAVLY